MRHNLNRGYQQLRVWQDAVEHYKLACSAYRGFPYELKRVAAQSIASPDSVHKNIAEGYARRSVKEYLQFLYVALGSLAECVSGHTACHLANQLTDDQFEVLDALAYELENGLLKLVASLEAKRDTKDWIDTVVVREANEVYTVSSDGETMVSEPFNSPVLQYSSTPGINK